MAAFLLAITGTITARVITSLGFGLFSYAALTTLAATAISSAQSKYALINADVLAMINLGGIGDFLGIICAALITKASLLAIKRLRPI